MCETETNLQWLIGYADPAEKAGDLDRHRFPSKVGGKPVSSNYFKLSQTFFRLFQTFSNLFQTSNVLH
jgi:hypothetical protein